MRTDRSTRVPSLRIEFDKAEIESITSRCAEVLRSGRLTLGPVTEEFESRVAAETSLPHAVAVSSGTAAIDIAVRALDLAGTVVLVPVNTNYATAAAVISAGATPRYYDSGLYPDIDDLKRCLDGASACVVVHIGGYITSDMADIRSVCEEAGVFLIEDAAQAQGAALDGRAAGAFGAVGTFSFYPTKVVTTGEGGMLVTASTEIAALARCLRDQGKDDSGLLHVMRGSSWRITELEAAIGCEMMRSFRRDAQRRVEVMDQYERELGAMLEFAPQAPGLVPGGYRCIAFADSRASRERIKRQAATAGVVLPLGVYENPLHRQPALHKTTAGEWPLADDFARRHFCLPVWRSIRDDEVMSVVEVLRQVV